MSLPSEQKALIFVGAIAVLGAGVRVVRASNESSLPANQPALDHQMSSADSAARAEHDRMRVKSIRRGRGNVSREARTDTNPRRRRVPPTDSAPPGPVAERPLSPLERKGYVGNRLDLDVATAAQIDSLPGVLPAMAKRIVVDRLARGPFLSMNGLRRVSGVGAMFMRRIDSLVTFSGTIVQPNAADTTIAKRRRGKSEKALKQ